MATTTLGCNATFTLDGNDLSDFINNLSFGESADSLDVTTFGNKSHRKVGGLFDGAISADGIYDTTANGPRDVVQPLIGTVVPIIWRPEGAGMGLPETTGDVLVVSYNETAPVAEVVSFSIALELDDDWAVANQA
jgi:hypothetical protein